MKARVGILALQGAVHEHERILEGLRVEALRVRRAADLEGLSHLILPGGESTTIRLLLDLFEITEPLVERHRAGELALFGVCAGAILLGRESEQRPRRLGLLDVAFERNAFGRQLQSFRADVDFEDGSGSMPGTFIRAPRIGEIGDRARVLARHAGEAVAVRAPGLLACTFHPELAGSPDLHRIFLGKGIWGEIEAEALAGRSG